MSLHHFKLRSLRFAALAAAAVAITYRPLPAVSATNDVSAISTNAQAPLQFRASTLADGEGVFLNQLIEPASDLPRLRIADSPLFGKSLLLKRADIQTLSAAAGFNLALTDSTGPLMTRVTRKSRSLGEHELIELLSGWLQEHNVRDLGQIELRLSRPWTPVAIADEAFTLKVLDIPTSGIAANFIARFELETAFGEHLGPWQTSLQARVWREVWVARSPIKRGEPAATADLVRERRDLLLCHEAMADLISQDAALEFVEPVPQGAPILARFIKPRAVVRRGQNLAAVIQDGALMITLKVEALEDGAAGQFIRVRNPLSRRDLHAKIVDEQNVLVSL